MSESNQLPEELDLILFLLKAIEKDPSAQRIRNTYIGNHPLVNSVTYLSNYYFDNQEGGVEGLESSDKYLSSGKYDTIQNSFKSEILELSKNNKIILIYPIPEVGWDPKQKILSQWSKNKFYQHFDFEYITTSFNVYKERNLY